jgi:hypothetical protein
VTEVDGPVIRLARVVGGLVWVNTLWLLRCILMLQMLGATSAMYIYVREIVDGSEPPTWSHFGDTARKLQRGHRVYSAFSCAAALSAIVLVVGAVKHPGLLAGLYFGWACALMAPVLAFALAAQRSHATAAGSGGLALRELSAISPTFACGAATLHLLVPIAILCLPHQVIVIALSVCGALPAWPLTRSASRFAARRTMPTRPLTLSHAHRTADPSPNRAVQH